MDFAAMASLVSSLGSSAAAIFAMWFLTTSFLKRDEDQRKEFTASLAAVHEQVFEIAKEKGGIIKDDAVAMRDLSRSIAEMNAILLDVKGLMSSMVDKKEG